MLQWGVNGVRGFDEVGAVVDRTRDRAPPMRGADTFGVVSRNDASAAAQEQLFGELQRIGALGDIGIRCAAASAPCEVLGVALEAMREVMGFDLVASFGVDDDFVDPTAFREPGAAGGEARRPLEPELAAFLLTLRAGTAHRVAIAAVPHLASLLDFLFAASCRGTTAVMITLWSKSETLLGAIVAADHPPIDGAGATDRRPESGTIFLALLARYIDFALQAVLLRGELRSQRDELTESTRRSRLGRDNLERAQRDLLQARKLEAIGRLAGGIAHDFNNLLTVIHNHVAFLRETLRAGSTELEDLDAIGQAAERATRITRQLLAFGRRDEWRPEAIDINRLTSELTAGIAQLVGEHIRIDCRLEPTIGPVRADRGQLEQVLLNLLVNARDAMPEGGVATVTSRHTTMADLSGTSLPKDPSQYIALIVADIGAGMAETTRARLFEPFFTTKQQGQGTGLGLATVYGIIEKHGGHIAVASQLGFGTTFTILLPCARRSAMTMQAVKIPTPRDANVSATILLVEDYQALRHATQKTLEGGGYSVLSACDGVEALSRVRSHPNRIDLILTDVVMPRMTGPNLARELRELLGDVPIIYMSGYTFDILDPHALEDGTFLSKPFAPEDLLVVVRNVLIQRGISDN